LRAALRPLFENTQRAVCRTVVDGDDFDLIEVEGLCFYRGDEVG
jgi:hypothetical protein